MRSHFLNRITQLTLKYRRPPTNRVIATFLRWKYIMFLAFVAAIIVFPVGILSAPLARLPKRNCLGGRKHGTQVDLQDFWYFCNDGKLENRGCFAQHRKRVVVGELHTADGLETLCYEDEFTSELRLKYTGCSVDGQLHGANDFWNDPSNRLWYFCEQLGSDRLRLNYGGCVWGDERIAKGKQIVRDGVVYTCHEKIADQEPGLRPSGCMHFAKRFNLGNTFETEDFWYSCHLSVDGTRGIKKVKGCVHNGERMEAGARYAKDGVIYQCTLQPEAVHEPVGCVVKTNEHDAPNFYPIGTRWTTGYAPYKYQVECLKKDTQTTVEEPVACAYIDLAGREHLLELGCVDEIDAQAIACRRDEKGILVYAMFNAKLISLASDFDLNLCDT